MFNYDDTVFVLDNGTKNGNQIKILKRTVDDINGSLLTLTGKSTFKVESWAVFPTVEKATQFGVAFLISTKEFNKVINKDTNISNLYKDIEKEHPNLIMKYMERVVEE